MSHRYPPQGGGYGPPEDGGYQGGPYGGDPGFAFPEPGFNTGGKAPFDISAIFSGKGLAIAIAAIVQMAGLGAVYGQSNETVDHARVTEQQVSEVARDAQSDDQGIATAVSACQGNQRALKAVQEEVGQLDDPAAGSNPKHRQ